MRRVIPIRTRAAAGAHAVCVLGMLLVFGCTTAVKPDTLSPRIAFLGMLPVEIGLLEQTFQVRLRIENPNGFPLPIKGLDYELFVNGEQFLVGAAAVPTEIAPFESVVVQLPGRGSILEWINSQEPWDGGSVSYRITGHAHLAEGFGRIPFERDGEIRLDSFAGTLI